MQFRDIHRTVQNRHVDPWRSYLLIFERVCIGSPCLRSLTAADSVSYFRLCETFKTITGQALLSRSVWAAFLPLFLDVGDHRVSWWRYNYHFVGCNSPWSDTKSGDKAVSWTTMVNTFYATLHGISCTSIPRCSSHVSLFGCDTRSLGIRLLYFGPPV